MRATLTLSCLLVLSLAWIGASGPRSEGEEPRKKVAVDEIEYKGWKKNVRLSNGDAELIITRDVGPRVISYRLANGKNVFKEYEDQLGKTGEADWQIRGGHRLWIAPEDLTRTYAPDNGPVQHAEIAPGRHRFTPAADKPYGVQRAYDVRLAPSGSAVTVTHRVTNVGEKPTELAIWALSVMAPGGLEVIPLPAKRPHPGSPKNARSPADFAPNQRIALWPFFDFKDPRWTFGSRYLTLKQDPKATGPTKLGLAHREGWVGYLNDGTLFVKRFPYKEGETYPDEGVNYETFTNADMLELETLSPLVKLDPGATIEHVEHWELIAGIKDVTDEDSIDQNIRAKVMPSR